MCGFHTIWDIETGTSLGADATEDEALAIVPALILANAPDYADALELGYQDDTGSWRAIATGATLADRARAVVAAQPTGVLT